MFPELKLISDVVVNDIDKELFEVPAGEVYELLWLYCTLVTTSTVGDRRIQVQVRDADDVVVFATHSKHVQAASITGKFSFFPGAAGTNDSSLLEDSPLPQPLFIPSGYNLRVFEENEVHIVDDVLLYALVRRYQVG